MQELWKEKTSRLMLLILLAQVPVFGFAAYLFDSSVGISLGLAALVLAGPAIAYWRDPASRFCSIMIAVGAMGMSALLIHIGHGMIEMHFHIFVMLGLLIVLGDQWAILAAAGTTAAHHILFWLLLPASLFNYDAGFGIVVIHALFVVFETIPACYVAHRFRSAHNAETVAARMPAAVKEVASPPIELRTPAHNCSPAPKSNALPLRKPPVRSGTSPELLSKSGKRRSFRAYDGRNVWPKSASGSSGRRRHVRNHEGHQ